jgi:hypothetical protein
MLRPATRTLFEAAGIRKGMRARPWLWRGRRGNCRCRPCRRHRRVPGIDRSTDAVKVSRVGIHTAAWARLWTVARDAGLQPLSVVGVRLYFAPDNPNDAALLAGIVRTLVPLLERTGVASAAEMRWPRCTSE